MASSVGGGSRRGSVDSDGGFPFRLKKSKPVSQVKIVFMGKPMVSYQFLTKTLMDGDNVNVIFSGIDGTSK